MSPRITTPDFFAAHRDALLRLATKIVGDRAFAEDVVQEAYLRFDAAMAERSLEHPLAYLYRVVRNHSLDTRRRIARERSWQEPLLESRASHVEADAPTPEQHALARDELRLLGLAMAEMPERMRRALEMHRFGGCTFKEIAAELEVSVGTAHALVVEAIERCRDRLYR